jgi:hypothetical protein
MGYRACIAFFALAIIPFPASRLASGQQLNSGEAAAVLWRFEAGG